MTISNINMQPSIQKPQIDVQGSLGSYAVLNKTGTEKTMESAMKALANNETDSNCIFKTVIVDDTDLSFKEAGEPVDIECKRLPTEKVSDDIFKRVLGHRPWFEEYYSMGTSHDIFEVDYYQKMTLEQILFTIIAGPISEAKIAKYVCGIGIERGITGSFIGDFKGKKNIDLVSFELFPLGDNVKDAHEKFKNSDKVSGKVIDPPDEDKPKNSKSSFKVYMKRETYKQLLEDSKKEDVREQFPELYRSLNIKKETRTRDEKIKELFGLPWFEGKEGCRKLYFDILMEVVKDIEFYKELSPGAIFLNVIAGKLIEAKIARYVAPELEIKRGLTIVTEKKNKVYATLNFQGDNISEEDKNAFISSLEEIGITTIQSSHAMGKNSFSVTVSKDDFIKLIRDSAGTSIK